MDQGNFAAGIVLVYKNEYFLLGKENNTWSGFSGGADVNESIEDCALREFNEETCNTFDLHISKANTIDRLMDCTPLKKSFYLYFIDYPELDLKINDKFIKNKSKENRICYLEKECIGWFHKSELKKLRYRRCFYKQFMEYLQKHLNV